MCQSVRNKSRLTRNRRHANTTRAIKYTTKKKSTPEGGLLVEGSGCAASDTIKRPESGGTESNQDRRLTVRALVGFLSEHWRP